MSDNIIDFNKRRRELIKEQPVSEVSMETLMKGLTAAPQNSLMANVIQSVQEKLTRLLIFTDGTQIPIDSLQHLQKGGF